MLLLEFLKFYKAGIKWLRTTRRRGTFKFKTGDKMIEINLYKDILCITIDESRIERFCALFAEQEFELKQGGDGRLKCDRDMRLKFSRGERSEAVVTKNCVSIRASTNLTK